MTTKRARSAELEGLRRVEGMTTAPRAGTGALPEGARAAGLDPMMILATCIAAGLGLLFLGRKSFFLDEVFSVFAAKLDLSHLWGLVTSSQANMSFYYFLLHLWIGLGDGEVAVRSLSVLAAVGTVPLSYLLAKRLFGSAPAAFASVLLSLNAFFIYYAQEARGYSLVLLLVTISSYSFVRSIEDPSGRRWWLTYAASSTLAVYTHLFAVFVPLAHLLSLPFLTIRPMTWKPLAVTLSAIALCTSPMALFVLTRDVGQIDWIVHPTLNSLVGAFLALVGHGSRLLVVYFVLCCLALRPLLRRSGGATPDGRWRFAFVLSWLFTPIVLSFLFSLTIKPIFVPQYLIVSLPPLVLLAGAGIASLGRRWPQVVVSSLVIVLASQSLVTYYHVEREDWRGVTSFVLGHSTPSDAIVFDAPYVRAPFEYYLTRSGSSARAPHPLYPGAAWSSNTLSEPGGPDMPDLLNTLTTAPYERVWLVLSHDAVTPRGSEESRSIQLSLTRAYAQLQERTFDGVRVILYERIAPQR